MEFTKEYIKECDCKKIQGLRDIKYGDWIYDIATDIGYEFDEHNSAVFTDKPFSFIKGQNIWLPTGDQLDDLIVGICRNGMHNYIIKFLVLNRDYQVIFDSSYLGNDIEISDDNPLIAKIKLLKELLNGKKKTN